MRAFGLKAIVLVVLFSMPISAEEQDFASLTDTRHDLALYPRPVSPDQDENMRCVFCHAPNSQSPSPGAWNEDQPDHLFDYPYDRPAAALPDGKPDGSSLVCLGCHDGTIALGDIASRTKSARVVADAALAAKSHGHPVSVSYEPSSALDGKNMASRGDVPQHVRLDHNGKVQCTTCHDPHDGTNPNFLVMEDGNTALCVSCHRKPGWSSSSHNNASAAWNHRGPDPWPYADSLGTVADYGCANCHAPHTAGDGRNLLNFSFEEDNCLACHNGNVADTDIRSDFNKVSRHPVELTTAVHRSDEPVHIAPSERHVECVDCHDPHSSPAKRGVREYTVAVGIPGIDVNGTAKTEIVAEYELCFRCHGDGSGRRAMPTPRVHDQSNVRQQFDSGNPSFHPVLAPGNNLDVPSLIAPLAENSTIRCTDCHSSDADSRSGGQGPDGPHGSIYRSLLNRNYQTQDRTPESPSAYALCYSCHDRTSILNDESFSEHRLHVNDNNAPCSACHDPHGISFTQGNSDTNSHLINFDTSIVFPNAGNELRFEDRGNQAGACFLACHNSNHDGTPY